MEGISFFFFGSAVRTQHYYKKPFDIKKESSTSTAITYGAADGKEAIEIDY